MRPVWSARAILITGWVIAIVYAYPGFLDMGSVDQLVDARNNSISDYHSPVLTQVWAVTELFIAGPAGMLMLQISLLLFGMYGLLRSHYTARIAALVSCLIVLFPPVLATTGVINREALLVGCLLCGALGLRSASTPKQLGGLCLLILSAGLRPGSMFAVLPIVLATFVWRPGLPRLKRIGVATAAWGGILIVSLAFIAWIVPSPARRADVELAMSDLSGIALYEPDANAESTLPSLTESMLTRENRSILLSERARLIREYPTAYLSHRVNVFAGVIGLWRDASWRPLYVKYLPKPEFQERLGHVARRAPPQRVLVALVRSLSTGMLFRPYVYLLIALTTLPLALSRRRIPAIMLISSALLLELSLALSVATPTFRDSHWLLAATLVALALTIAPRPTLPA